VVKKIQAERAEFNQAQSNESIYGSVREYVDGRMRRFSVYVELGKEGNYKGHPKDDPKTEYKIFYDSIVYYAVDDSACDASEFFHSEPPQTVIIFC
jgi:hypothetical protein